MARPMWPNNRCARVRSSGHGPRAVPCGGQEMTGARTPRSRRREWGQEVCPTPLPRPSRAILLGESGLLSCLPFSWSSKKSPENPKCHIFFFSFLFFRFRRKGIGSDLFTFQSLI